MGVSMLMSGVLFGIIGIFIGSAEIAGVCPLAIGYMIAVCINRKNVPIAYLGLICGFALKLSQTEFFRYGIILLGIMLLLCSRYFDTLGRNPYTMAFFAGVITLGVDIAVSLFTDESMRISDAFFETILAMAAGIIYARAIGVLYEDGFAVATDNTAAISVIAFLASVLYGMPFGIGNILIAEPFAIFSILCFLYIFGLGIGLTWAAVSGMILSYMRDDNVYLTVWLPLLIMAYAINTLLHGRRILFAGIFSVLYFIYGNMFSLELVNEEGLKGLISGSVLFVFLPSNFIMQLGKRVNYNNSLEENSPEWGKLMVQRISELANAFKRIDYTMVTSQGAGIGFKEVGGIIEDFTNQLEKKVTIRKTTEARILDELLSNDIEVKNFTVLKNNRDFYEIFITARVKRGRLVAAELVRKIVEKHMNIELSLGEESRNIVGRNYEVIALLQKPQYKCITEIRRLSRYANEVSGDNLYIGDIRNGQKLIMLADGMGNGKRASEDSMALIDSLEELLNAGFDKEISIKLVNTYLSKRNQGETFATLDMILIDLFTGYGNIYKQGAATTYIKRGEWLEMIKSTSLPVGVVEDAICEKCSKKLYANDIIVMLSDGMLESLVVENKEDYMKDFLMDLDSDSPEEIAEELVDCVRLQSGNRLRDDATVIVCKLVKSL